MKTAFLILVFLHGFIHLLGFVKAFGLREVKELPIFIPRPLGLLWLATAVLFIIYGINYLTNYRYTWLIGVVAIVISQILVIIYWKEAKFGTIPNIVILIVSIMLFGFNNFNKLVQEEVTLLLNPNNLPQERVITQNSLEDLPGPVKKWLLNSGAVGKPFISVGKVIQKAEMKMKPGQDNWMNATAIQYTTIDNPAFIWKVDVKMNSLLSFQGRDKFENGKGEMLIKVNSLINVVNERGEKIDEGTIQRFLGEMVWFPSLALSPYITWEQINDTIAKATMNYKETIGSGIFHFNSDGDFIKFTALRFKGNEAGAKRHEWVLSVNDYRVFDGIKVPAKMTATWKLDEGDWTWLNLEIKDIKYNENVRQQ